MNIRNLPWLPGLAVLALSSPSGAAIPANAVKERIDKTISSPAYEYGDPKTSVPAFSWTAKYDRYFDGSSVVKHVEIDFQFDASTGFTDQQKSDWKKAAEKDVESAWNDKFTVDDTTNGRRYAVKVDVTVEGPFDQVVSVVKKPGDCDSRPNDLDCRDNMSKWFSDSKPATRAHEFGHMIGNRDEYLGGAIDKVPDPTLSDDGVMGLGAVSDSPKMYPRYYQQFADFMNGLTYEQYTSVFPTGGPDKKGVFVLTMIPEPQTWLMLALGTALLPVALRRRR